jgi:hypothetical protein
MVISSFDEANAVLDKPADMTRDECEPASVLRTETMSGQSVVVSCWKVTKEELEEIQRTGRVWLMSWGVTMPPSAVLGTRPF